MARSSPLSLRLYSSDMWKPYLLVVAEVAGQTLNILDRFHIMVHMNKAIDKVRAQEVRDLKAKGKQDVKLTELLACNLRTTRAYLLKEDFQVFWEYKSPAWAGKFLDSWCTRTMRSRIEPMKKVARMLRAHRSLLLNWFRAMHWGLLRA